jgi:hypothetical protein
MFVQVIRGKAADPADMRAAMDRWQGQLREGAIGWLGSTAGVADDGEFVAVARFESAESARANSERPEQDAWWREMVGHLEGEPTVGDCERVEIWPAEPSDDAGFVQVIEGRISDADRAMQLMRESGDAVRQARPDIIGGLIALAPDGRFTQVVYFTSEEEARKGEAAEAPELDERMTEAMSSLSDLTYVDLRQPWLTSPGS